MDYIEINGGAKFLVLSTHVLNEKKYLFLASVSEKPEYIFAEFFDGGELEVAKDEELIKNLILLAAKKVEKM